MNFFNKADAWLLRILNQTLDFKDHLLRHLSRIRKAGLFQMDLCMVRKHRQVTKFRVEQSMTKTDPIELPTSIISVLAMKKRRTLIQPSHKCDPIRLATWHLLS